jgi:hypothetical protein
MTKKMMMMAAAAFLLAAGAQAGNPGVTQGNYFAADAEKDLDTCINYCVEKDYAALGGMIRQGLRVFIEDQPFLSGKVSIRLPGSDVKIWTVTEAVAAK